MANKTVIYGQKIKISDLNLAEYNPRVMTEKAQVALRASLNAFGLITPIIINQRSKRIIGGHQRVQQMIVMGETEAEVDIVDLNEEDEKALNLILNSERARGEMLSEPLQLILEELKGEPDYIALRLEDLLEEAQTTELEDKVTFEDPNPKPTDKRKDGEQLTDGATINDDDANTIFLRLHYTRAEADEIEGLLGQYMLEHKLGSMTEAVLRKMGYVEN
jgi:hypothetical protein